MQSSTTRIAGRFRLTLYTGMFMYTQPALEFVLFTLRRDTIRENHPRGRAYDVVLKRNGSCAGRASWRPRVGLAMARTLYPLGDRICANSPTGPRPRPNVVRRTANDATAKKPKPPRGRPPPLPRVRSGGGAACHYTRRRFTLYYYRRAPAPRCTGGETRRQPAAGPGRAGSVAAQNKHVRPEGPS